MLVIQSLCALVLVIAFGDSDFEIQAAHSRPYHCAKGAFAMNKADRIVRVTWVDGTYEHLVWFKFDRLPDEGQLEVIYYWGDSTVTVNGRAVMPVATADRIRGGLL